MNIRLYYGGCLNNKAIPAPFDIDYWAKYVELTRTVKHKSVSGELTVAWRSWTRPPPNPVCDVYDTETGVVIWTKRVYCATPTNTERSTVSFTIPGHCAALTFVVYNVMSFGPCKSYPGPHADIRADFVLEIE